MADSLDSILLDYATALDAAEAAVQDLLSLASCEVLDVDGSSKVARAKTRFTDQTRICKRSLCDLQFAVEDEDRSDLTDSLRKAQADLKRVQREHMAAQQALASASARASEAQRQRLLAGGASPAALNEARRGTNAVTTSENITSSLRQSLKMLNEEVELASGNLSLINNSAAKLAHTSEEYNRQESRLKKSRGLLRLIKYLDRREDLLLYAGIAIFCAAALYVVLRRTLHFIPAIPAIPSIPSIPTIPWESLWPQEPPVLQEQPMLHMENSPEL